MARNFYTHPYATMTKRTFEDFSQVDAIQFGDIDEQPRPQRQQLVGFLEQGKKVLFRALKVARGIERQKLGRRQKAAKADGNDEENARLQAEVSALKVCWSIL